MKKVFSFIHKRVLAFVLAVAITVTGFSALGLEADAASYAKLGMTLTGSKVDIPELGISNHDLWYLTCGGSHVFCLTPGGGTHTNDSYRVTKTNPMTYSFNGSTKKGKEIARAMTYWGSEMSYSITNHKALQSYLWSIIKSKDSATCVRQATGWSSAAAEDFVDKIKATDIYGTLYVYTFSSCVRSSTHGHQDLIRWVSKEYSTVKKKTVTASKSLADSEDLELTATKKDAKTGAKIDTARFKIYRDGVLVTKSALKGKKVTNGTYSEEKYSTKNGIVKFTYVRKYKTKPYSGEAVYITNWNAISEKQQKEMLKSGYYSTRAKAKAAAKEIARKKAEAALKSLKSESHTWKIVETNAPAGHALSANKTQTATEKASKKSLSFTFSNAPQRGYIKIQKSNTLDLSKYGFSNTGSMKKTTDFTGAVYQIRAAGTIYKDDNRTVAYNKGDLVTRVTLNKSGTGTSAALYEGAYTVQEEKAPKGFRLNATAYNVTVSIPDSDTTKTFSVNVGDTESYGFSAKKVTRDYSYDDTTGKLQTQDLPEAGAKFDLYYLNGSTYVKIKTYTSDANGAFSQTDGLVPGRYKLHQVSGKTGYSLAADKIFDITRGMTPTVKNLGTLINPGTLPDYGFISIEKEYDLVDPEDSSILLESGKEEGAAFEILDAHGQVVDRLTTDEEGRDTSIALAEGTYTIRQTAGKAGYSMIPDDTGIVVVNGQNNERPVYHNYSNGMKIRIQKSMTDPEGNDPQPEEDAEFYVIDTVKAGEAGISLYMPVTENDRKDYAQQLEEAGCVLGIITTDETGYGSLVLEQENVSYCLLQTGGADGYALQNRLIYSTSAAVADAPYGKVHTFTLSDPKLEAGNGYIAVNKLMTQSGSLAVAEEGAQFQILDAENRTEICTMTTAADGSAISEKLESGTYIVHQTAGKDSLHRKMNDFYVTIPETSQGNTYYVVSKFYRFNTAQGGFTYLQETMTEEDSELDAEISASQGYLLNPENLVRLKLTKYDEDDAAHPVRDAVYGLYDSDGNAVLDEDGNSISMITDENGVAELRLPYGVYYIREELAPKGYSRNSALMKAEITAEGLTLSRQQEGSGQMELTYSEVKDEGLSSDYTPEELEGLKQDYLTKRDAMDAAKTAMDKAYADYLTLCESANMTALEPLMEAYRYAQEAYDQALSDYTNAEAALTSAENSGDFSDEEIEELRQACEEAKVIKLEAEQNMNDAFDALQTQDSEFAAAQKDYLEKSRTYEKALEDYTEALSFYESVTAESDVVTCYSLSDKDKPIYGKLSLHKTGKTLSGADKGDNGIDFLYADDVVAGAEYTLYADEDITSYDGIVYHRTGEEIAKGVTNSDGKLAFFRTLENGTDRTDLLHLGQYYYVETKAPYGYALDDSIHYINLTDDTAAEELGGIDVGDGVPNTDETENQNLILATYDLGNGITATLHSTGIMEITGVGMAKTFASQAAVPWYQDNNYLKIQKVITGSGVSFTSLAYYFYGCTELTSLEMKGSDLSNLTTLAYAFYNCHALSAVTGFQDCTKLTDISHAFEGCYLITTPPDFSGCTAITATDYAFADCHSLASKAELASETATTYEGCINLPDTSASLSGISGFVMAADSTKAAGLLAKAVDAVQGIADSISGDTAEEEETSESDGLSVVDGEYKEAESEFPLSGIEDSWKEMSDDMLNFYFGNNSITNLYGFLSRLSNAELEELVERDTMLNEETVYTDDSGNECTKPYYQYILDTPAEEAVASADEGMLERFGLLMTAKANSYSSTSGYFWIIFDDDYSGWSLTWKVDIKLGSGTFEGDHTFTVSATKYKSSGTNSNGLSLSTAIHAGNSGNMGRGYTTDQSSSAGTEGKDPNGNTVWKQRGCSRVMAGFTIKKPGYMYGNRSINKNGVSSGPCNTLSYNWTNTGTETFDKNVYTSANNDAVTCHMDVRNIGIYYTTNFPDTTHSKYTFTYNRPTLVVTLNANNGTGDTHKCAAHAYNTSWDLTNVSTCGFTRTGYHIHDGGEWNKNTSGTGTGFDQNVSYTAAQYLAITNNTYFTSKSLNLYVNWDKNTYTVKYNANGGTGTTASQSMSYDTAANLRSNAFTRTGYHFVRWNTKADNTGTGYSAGQSVKNLTATNGATINLYAIWAANTYTVKFNANGGTGTMADQSYTYNVAQNLRSNAFTNGTMIFTGWNTKADGTGTTYKNAQSVKNLTATNGGTVNLYAQWSAGTYTINYNGNGATGLSPDADPAYVNTGAGIMKDQTDVPVDQAEELWENCYVMVRESDEESVIFTGWNTKADGTGTAYKEGQAVTGLTTNGKNVTLYAQWAVYTTSDGVAYVTEDDELHFTGTCSGFSFASADAVPWTKDGYNKTVTSIDFNQSETASVNPQNMDYWFRDFVKLSELPEFTSCTQTASMKETFSGCITLKEGPDLTACSALQSVESAFENCTAMVIPPEFYPGDAENAVNTALQNLSGAFAGCVNLQYAPDLSKLKGQLTLDGMFDGCNNLMYTVEINTSFSSGSAPQNVFRDAAYNTTPVLLTSSLDEGYPMGIYSDVTYTMLTSLLSTQTEYSNVQILKLESIRVIPSQKEYPVSTDEEPQALGADDFIFIGQYTDGSEEVLDLTDEDVTVTPNTIPQTPGNFDVTISIKDTSIYYDYHKDGSDTDMHTTLKAVGDIPVEVHVGEVTVVEKEIEVEDPLIKTGFQIFKTDTKDQYLSGATFQLKTLVDIKNGKGDVIVPAGTVLREETTTESGSVSFAGLPTNRFTENGKGTTAMYEITETKAPTGYTKSDKVLTYSGEAVDDGEGTEDYIVGNVDDPVINTPKNEIVIKKVWDDGGNWRKERPETLTFEVMNIDSQETRTVMFTIPTADIDNNVWEIPTGLPRYDTNGNEIDYSIVEEAVENYTTEYFKDKNGIWNITNICQTKDLPVIIIIGKRIKASDISWANGNPIFLFTVKGVVKKDNSTRRFVRHVEFTKEYVASHTDAEGYVVLGTTLTGLPSGTYTAEEQEVSRYELESITDVNNGEISADGRSVTFTLEDGVRFGSAIFTNEKFEWQGFSHNGITVNTIGDTTSITEAYYSIVDEQPKLVLLVSKENQTTYKFMGLTEDDTYMPHNIQIRYDNTTLSLTEEQETDGCLYENGVLTLSEAVGQKIAENWKTAIQW